MKRAMALVGRQAEAPPTAGLAAYAASAEPANLDVKLWTLNDLQILHQLQQPVVVLTCQNLHRYTYLTRNISGLDSLQSIVSCLHKSVTQRGFICCSVNTTRLDLQLLFQNAACLKRFGSSASAAPSIELLRDAEQASYLAWLDWNQQLSRVRAARSCSCVKAQAVLTCATARLL